ncbi:hypothetical protein [Aquimarina sp. 2201CG5-10]|uniref:hypothetical protein n=1 Tax=Aquimarina callyspongiae TaxID=3098150 RepID=UPI002AB32F4E|nr:hypothetical protein [Aquimarina sp. 2201CG5-10]MDY8136290.1 hypothetical protein [Aquimarina sp. 2201CG5-10]
MKTKINSYINLIDQSLGLQNPEQLLHLFLRLMLILLLLFMNDNAYLSIFMPVFLVPGILFKSIAHNKYYWLLLSVISALFYLVLDLVGYVPNHKHMFAYAIIAVTAVLFMNEKAQVLSSLGLQSRFIIGLCFLFATAGKFLAPEFLDGRFFDFTNTTDPRFFGVTSIVGDIDKQQLILNESNLRNLINSGNPNGFFTLNINDKVSFLGMILSYWTIFIEGMIAISFCLPERFKLSKYRNWFLVAFILTTYPIATVAGFAIILTALGFMQSIEDNKVTNYSRFYLLVFLVLPLIDIPFSRIFKIFL